MSGRDGQAPGRAHDHAHDRTDLAWTRTLLAALALVLVQVRSAPGPVAAAALACTGLVVVLAASRSWWPVPRTVLLLTCVAAVGVASTLAALTALTVPTT